MARKCLYMLRRFSIFLIVCLCVCVRLCVLMVLFFLQGMERVSKKVVNFDKLHEIMP